MRQHRLKRIRVVVSLLFFILTALLFLDLRNWYAPIVGTSVLYLQFMPSLWKFFHGASLVATGFIVVLAATIAIGRIYCSTICPLGVLQDIIISLARKRSGKRPAFSYHKPQNLTRITVLIATILFIILGSNLVLNLFEPFSSFGRIMSNLLRPAEILLNNIAAMVLEQFGVYAVPREHWAGLAPLAVGVAAATAALITVMAASRGRLYCNSLCPVGTVLGYVARVSFLRLQIRPEHCSRCGRCESVCKAECIDIANNNIDMSRCVGCYNCLSICKTDGIRLGRNQIPQQQKIQETNTERREFLLNSGIYLLALSGLTEPGPATETVRKIIQAKPTTIPIVMTSPVSPPGSLSVAHFTARCTACHLCISACPPQILRPALLEYGISGMLQPRMYFQSGHCIYECTICGDVCPAGAIMPLAVEAKKLTQTGIATFIKDNCVVHTDKTACGACSEHCPTKAVNMVPYENPRNLPLGIPEINKDICIGCGACEHACPTKPYKAIFVDGNPVHKQAQKPVVKQVEQKVDYKEDFPF